MRETNYKNAYERQKKAREKAEMILEDKSRELYDLNQSLVAAYSKLKDQKAQILHQEKLASIGQLAAGVAHEINNPTGFIKGNIGALRKYFNNMSSAIEKYETLLQDFGKDQPSITTSIAKIKKESDLEFIAEDAEDLIEESLGGISRIENIVGGLKDFSRPDENTAELFSLNKCIENTLTLVSSEVKYKSEVKTNLEELPLVKGQPGAISQVILNLIVNASDAIEERGIISISTSANENEVRLNVNDSGPGIPQNLITRIFDPFFTTKDVGKGTGLGLSISHKIIKKHGGRMAVDSTEGSGTQFSIFLPLPKEETENVS